MIVFVGLPTDGNNTGETLGVAGGAYLAMTVFLDSPANGNITGEALSVAGGA